MATGSLVLKQRATATRNGDVSSTAFNDCKLRLLVAESRTLFRETMIACLESCDYLVVGQTENGREAVELAQELHPDIVLMGMSLPLLNGLDAAKRIHKEVEGTKVLLLADHARENLLYQVLKAGASGYLLKSAGLDDLQLAIREVNRGNPYVSSEASKMLIEELMNDKPMSTGADMARELTSRERELLQLFAEGYGNQEIAAQLFLSVKTVEAHKAHIANKLNLRGKTDFLRYALSEGLTTIEY